MPTVRFQLRRDTTANWTVANPVLGPGEPSIEIDTGLIKYGDGSTPWLDLAYAPVTLPDVLASYAEGDDPSDFTLSIVDAVDDAAWRIAIGAQAASDKLTALAGVTAMADGDHAFPGLTITTSKGLVTNIELATPKAASVSVDTSVNPPIVAWQMPDVPGWATAEVRRGSTSSVAGSVAVSDRQVDALFAPMMFEDDTLPAGNYWWWVRIYGVAGNVISTSTAATGTIS